MKLKNYLEKHNNWYEFFINKHFQVSITKWEYIDDETYERKYKYIIEYNSYDIACCDDEFDYEIRGIKLTGEETLSQVKKMIKNYFKQTKKVSDTKVIKSCYNEFNYDEYSMTMKNTKDFVNAMKKEFGIGNDFLFNEMGVYGLTQCAMYLGY